MIKELEYPFDANFILEKKKRLRRELLSSNENRISKNIAILGGSTTNDIKQVLELFLLNYGITPQFYESEYNQYYQDSVFPNVNLDNFKPDIIYICTSNRNIMQHPTIQNSEEEIEKKLNDEYSKFESIWTSLWKKYNCPIIQNNFESPFYRILGNRDIYDIHGFSNFIMRLNEKFYKYANCKENFYICDINYISSDYGLREWSDPFYWYMYKYALNVSAIPYLSYNVANIIKSLLGKNKKGFVLDLDNTLWGGVIGDDGVDNIILGQETSEGQAYVEFQRYIKQIQDLGVILNINSKNDYENALAGINHPDSVFSCNDFVCIKSNWDSKDKNYVEIANCVNLAPESLVFVDDNPAERNIVTEHVSGVSAPEISNVSQYIMSIDRAGYFEMTSITNDDLKRNEMYQNDKKRVELAEFCESYDDYLISLDMRGDIKNFTAIYLQRIAQLTNKSNQFNLTTRRYTQTDIEKISTDKNYITLYGRLSDRFGDNGIVTVLIGHILNNECHMDLWIMSCRVLKRDMEYAMMDALVEQCKIRKLNRIVGFYYPTLKNSMVKDFYLRMGFLKISEDSEGNTIWVFEIKSDYSNKNKVIKMEEQK